MRVAIIGAGFTGLAAATKLVDQGCEVVVYESQEKAGGLAIGFKDKIWKWPLEKYYHHIFANDKEILALAKKVGAKVLFRKPTTKVFVEGRFSELDSPLSLIKNPEMSLIGKLRMGLGLVVLKMLPMSGGIRLESKKVVEVLPKLVGDEGYRKVWEPLMVAKFGSLVDKVNMAWFWARIYKRTKALGYFEGGFEMLAQKCVEYVTKKGGEIRLGTKAGKMVKKGEKVVIDGEEFDAVILTVPAPLVDKLIGEGNVVWPKIEYLWGQTLVLEMRRSLIDSYWLNILENEFPFLVVVEHTHFVNAKNYGGKKIVYIGNYLEDGDRRLSLNEKQLLELYKSYLVKINPDFAKSWVSKMWKWQAPFAQPVFPRNYSKKLPEFKTKTDGVYVANMSMVYPWDRGTNYAVALGEKVADQVLCEL